MFRDFGFVLLRAPLLSLNDINNIGDISNVNFQEGLYLASRDFWYEYRKQIISTLADKAKADRTIAKYWIRSCSRCTPFATFAGTSLIDIDDSRTNIVVASDSHHLKKVRLDMQIIFEIIKSVSKAPALISQLKYYPNNSIYQTSDTFRYADSGANIFGSYVLSSIHKTEYLERILKFSVDGATIQDMVELLILSEDVSENDAFIFITDMIDSHLLISALEPEITGDNPLDMLVEKLNGFQGVDEIVTELIHIRNRLSSPDWGVSFYQEIEEILKGSGMFNGKSRFPKDLFQLDMFLAMESNTISKATINNLISQAEELLAFSKKMSLPEIDDFKKRFLAKYEEMEIPLSILMDADLGIGYGKTIDGAIAGDILVDDLFIEQGEDRGRYEMDDLKKFSFFRYTEWIAKGGDVIELTEKQLEPFNARDKMSLFSNSAYISGSILKDGNSGSGFLFDLNTIGGPSAGNLVGRFTYGDERLKRITREMLLAEEKEDPDFIFAEVAHLPAPRVGNVLFRPVLRRYEIPYVGKSGIGQEQQIPINDILVCVRNNEVILRSRKHNKRIIPRLSTAHNFRRRSLPIYQFLCDLQYQNTNCYIGWDWGLLSDKKHLPRVKYKNIILKKACWLVNQDDIIDLPENESERAFFFSEFRNRLKMPSRVTYSEQDNSIVIDLERSSGCDLLVHYVNRKKSIKLEEFLFTEQNCIVSGSNNRSFTNEFIIPICKDKSASRRSVAVSEPKELIKRKYLPGDGWVYFKIYCGSKSSEKILKNTILPFIESGIEQKLFDKFFFIRYRDEFPHFRIRFFNQNVSKQANLQELFLQVIKPLIQNNDIDKVVVDTYMREVERYGADLIEDSEDLFYSDSLAVLRFINLLEGDESEKYRLLFAMRGIDTMLTDFNFTLDEKSKLLKILQASFFKEFGAAPFLQKQLNDRYRTYQRDIFLHLNSDLDENNDIVDAVEIFNKRSESNYAIIERMKKKVEPGTFEKRIDELVPHYIHMFMNRMFITKARQYELIIYHFLERYYSSQIAIFKKK
ncbi:lantibiotic dehydratase [Chitinophaga polysaccharea]|uniref:lantibiotic dehydratase n=1 Tax=Chitinophaga polysaccharea TaxID=1293035 RepID=UPI001455BCF4|nr:lantibiotic dehydratase [Chitinophaga polysaccharea]NLR56936.1 lantibiotic dehydratase [Chitinophaga polysaccharea]